MPLSEFVSLKDNTEGGLEGEEFMEELLRDICYLFSIGLKNPLREHVNDSISLIKYGVKISDS
jgi:hypothetical protein